MCKYPVCAKQAITGGLCPACYSRAYNQVRKGHITWDELFETGFADLDRLTQLTTEQRSTIMRHAWAEKRRLGLVPSKAKKPSLADLDNQMIDTLYPPGYNGVMKE